MLKIKDNIDLKELEKFGFNRLRNGKDIIRYTYWAYGNPSSSTVTVDYTTRMIITLSEEDGLAKVDDKLFDLIQAGLVEKVEDK